MPDLNTQDLDTPTLRRRKPTGAAAVMTEAPAGIVTPPDDPTELEDWLDQQIAAGAKKPFAIAVYLTKPLAALLMTRNDGNRALNEATVVAYARDMAAGAWSFNGEPLIFSKEGLLNDGQHRAAAAERVGRPIPVMMNFGFDRESRATLDQGKARTAANYLQFAGIDDATTIAAVLGMIWRVDRVGHLMKGATRATKAEIVQLYNTVRGLPDSIAATRHHGGVAAPSTLAYIHWRIANATGDRNAADTFIHQLTTGAELKADNPILYTRSRLLGEDMPPHDKVSLIFATWNICRAGRTVRTIPINRRSLPDLLP